MNSFSANSDNFIKEGSSHPQAQSMDQYAEIIAEKIRDWQLKLIDLSPANPLLNHSETGPHTLKIINPDFLELFGRLAINEESLMFWRHLDKTADAGAFAVMALFENLGCPLNMQAGDLKTAGDNEERDETLYRLKTEARLIYEEQGVNALHLYFGFLEYDDGQKAPLVLLPVQLEQASLNAPFFLKRRQEDFIVNPALQHRLATQHGLDLPEIDADKPDLEAFIQAAENLANLRGWRIHRETGLGLASPVSIAMFRDLSLNRERIASNPFVRAICGDRSQIKDIPSHLRNFDFDSVPPTERWQVLNADAYQQEAIELSKTGLSFVLQGAPGTGKSQTIANIIAEAIAHNKKVLFVSKKTAALQSVYERLTANSLADFCLPLYDHTLSKRQIRDFVAANLHLPHHRVKEHVLGELNQLFDYRKDLNQYAFELHSEIAPLNLSIYSAYGFLAKYADAPDIEFTVQNPAGITNEFFHTMLYSVADLAESIRKLNGRIALNPWFNTKLTSINQILRNQITEASQGLDDRLKAIAQLLKEADNRFDLTATQSFKGALDLQKLLAAINATKPFPPQWLENDYRETLKATAVDTKNARKNYAALYHDIMRDFKPAILDFDLEAWLANINRIVTGLKNLDIDLGAEHSLELATAVTMDAKAKELLEKLHSTHHEYSRLAKSLGLVPGDSFQSMLALCDMTKAMVDTPSLQKHWFFEDLTSRFALIDAALKHRQNINDLTQSISVIWEREAFSFNYNAMLRRFKADYSGMFKNFNKSYRDDMRTVRTLAKDATKNLTDEMVLNLLTSLKRLDEEKQLFRARVEDLGLLFGQNECASESELDELFKALLTVEKLKVMYGGKVPEIIIRVVCDKEEFAPTYVKLAQLSQTLNIDGVLRAQARVVKLLGQNYANSDLNGIIFPMLEQILRHTGKLNLLIGAIGASSNREISPVELERRITSALKLKNMRADLIANDVVLQNTFKDLYNGTETDWDFALSELERIDELAQIMKSMHCEIAFAKNLSNNLETRKALEDLAQRLATVLEEAVPPLTVFKGLFHNGSSMEGFDLNKLAQKFDACINGFDKLDNLLAYKDAQNVCGQKGLAEFVQKVDKLENHTDIYAAFQKGFYTQWLNAVRGGHGSVNYFKRNLHDSCVQRFTRLDKNQLEIAKYRIRDKVVGEFPFRGGFVVANDETRILKRELDKKQRLLPADRLLNAIPGLLLQLKPCLMMSPLNVARLLQNEAYAFDMVVFDEASQITTCEAINAALRGKQIIIAGDSQQLPPSGLLNVYDDNSAANDDADDDPARYSILETALGFLPQRALNWHYRSRHEHLFAFSNREIYRGKLSSFPSPIENQPDYGVELAYVENGVYDFEDGDFNFNEAKKCVELLQEHLERHPERSLGILAFDDSQRRAVSRAVRQFRLNHPEHEAFFNADKKEAFFVKTAANAQGDERDAVILSLGYAKDKYGKMRSNFGPLSKPYGENLLNVAVSRARHNLKLVCSILPQDIDLEQNEARGVQLLRAYIDFAQNGVKALTPPVPVNYNAPVDDFAEALGAFLTAKGYKVQTHFGCSAYKIDIAVQHPNDPTRYVAAIECDGLMYIAAKTARDRDNLRRTILTDMGWPLYRAWSAEWFANFDLESARLLAFIDKMINADGRDDTKDQAPAEAVLTESAVVIKDAAPAPAITFIGADSDADEDEMLLTADDEVDDNADAELVLTMADEVTTPADETDDGLVLTMVDEITAPADETGDGLVLSMVDEITSPADETDDELVLSMIDEITAPADETDDGLVLTMVDEITAPADETDDGLVLTMVDEITAPADETGDELVLTMVDEITATAAETDDGLVLAIVDEIITLEEPETAFAAEPTLAEHADTAAVKTEADMELALTALDEVVMPETKVDSMADLAELDEIMAAETEPIEEITLTSDAEPELILTEIDEIITAETQSEEDTVGIPPMEPVTITEATPATSEETSTVEPVTITEVTPAVSEETPTVESVTITEATPATSEEAPPVEPVAITEVTPAAIEETSKVEPIAITEATPAVSEETPRVEPVTITEATPTTSEETPTVEPVTITETTPAAIEETPAVEPIAITEVTPATTEETPAVEPVTITETTPAAIEETPAVEPIAITETTPAATEEAPTVESAAITEVTPATSEEAPTVEPVTITETTPATTEETPLVEPVAITEATPATTEEAPMVESVAASAEYSIDADEDFADLTETEAAIAALTARDPDEEMPEPTLTKTLASAPSKALTSDGDLAELPADYAKFLETLGVPGRTAAKPAVEPILQTDENMTATAPKTVAPEKAAAPQKPVVQTNKAPAQANADNIYGFEYYEEADWAKAQLSPHSDKLTHLGEQILYVLRLEQPMHKELLCRRLVGVFNNQKVTSLVRKNVEKALTEKIADKIERDANDFISILNFKNVHARIPQSNLDRRAPEHIAQHELAAAIPVILTQSPNIKKAELLAETARVFGYGRRNNKITAAVDDAFALLVQNGVIEETAGNKVILAKGDA